MKFTVSNLHLHRLMALHRLKLAAHSGFKMSAMLEEVYKEADVRIMGGDSVASTTQTIKVS